MTENKITLSIYPNAFGLAYVISEGPKEIIDFGMKQIKKKDAEHFLKKFDYILDFFKPTVVILRDYDNSKSLVSMKYRKIWKSIEDRVFENGLPLYKYSREQIKDVFMQFKAESKYKIAKVIVSWYPQLKSRSPRRRKLWLNEDNQMGIFDSFALMVTHEFLI